jgi:hypothetical protein
VKVHSINPAQHIEPDRRIMHAHDISSSIVVCLRPWLRNWLRLVPFDRWSSRYALEQELEQALEQAAAAAVQLNTAVSNFQGKRPAHPLVAGDLLGLRWAGLGMQSCTAPAPAVIAAQTFTHFTTKRFARFVRHMGSTT